MRTAQLTLLATGLALALAAPVALGAQEVYRWVDANGTVHFTQVAPRDVPFERVTPDGRAPGGPPSLANPNRPRPTTEAAPTTTAAAPAATTAPAPSAELTPAQLERQAELQAQSEARLAEIAEVRRQNCELARQQYDEFTTYARIRVADDSGDMRIMTEEERAERVAAAEEAILANCEDAG